MTKAILIDAVGREVREVDCGSYKDILSLIGCRSFCQAWTFANNDTLFVDDEGLLKPSQHFFWLSTRDDQPLAGNGLLIGPDGRGIDDPQQPVRTTVEELRSMVTFIDRAAAVEWARGNPDALATRITTVGPAGEMNTEVIPVMPDAFPETLEAP